MGKIRQIYQEYSKIKLERELTIDAIKTELGELSEKIVLYGAGSAGIAFLYYLRDAGIEPRFFSDGSESRWHQTCEGLMILPPQEIVPEMGEDCLVIITINTDGKNYCKSFEEALRKGGPSAVHRRLATFGCKNVIEYTFFRRCFELFRHEKYNLPSCSDVFLMEDRLEDLERIDEWLSDDISRETFEKIIEFRMLDDTITVPTFEQRDEYFAYDIYRKISDESFVDCGAYTGTTLDIFLENNRNQFSEYYAIEPDSANYKELLKNLDNKGEDIRGRISHYCAAAYDSSGKEISFYSLHSPGSFVTNTGNDITHTIRIDDILDGKKASCIKMNIEGSEIAALNGARKTIERYRPVLAISGYHKTWDLWEIPMLIKNIMPEYHLFMRSYMNHISFLFYAVPRERLSSGAY